MQKRTYQQLQPEERMTIASVRQQGSAATVSRELARNTCPSVGYASVSAHALSTTRRQAAHLRVKLHAQSVAWRIVLTLLDWKWSPQQISGTLKRMWPNDPTLRVSRETIYTAIYAQPRG
jgi:IS30 family transposase